MIKQIKFASIPVQNQSRALAFYTEKMGFDIVTDQPFGDGRRWIEVRPSGAETKIVLFTPDGEEDRIGTSSNMVFGAKDVRKTCEELKERGVEFTTPPTDQPWGVYAEFKDSEGNQFVLSSVD